jgi:hypothetical protein
MASSQDLVQHFAIFQKLVGQAESQATSGNYHAAAVFTEIAAAYATHHHTGVFTSNRLERVLLQIGAVVARDARAEEKQVRSGGQPRHVLHVVTAAWTIGGLSRMVWRWIQNDTESRHSIVLTRQHGSVPEILTTAAEASGGKLHRLNNQPGNILSWSGALRRLAVGADLIVLHIHPYDAIPLIALSDKRGMPPVALLNLVDHRFWLGVATSDLVVNQRHSGARLSQARRSIDPKRFGFLPIVLSSATRILSAADAKAQLGLPRDSILLLSIARPNKYAPLSGFGSQHNDFILPDAILPVLDRYPSCTLMVVGPKPDVRWDRASQATGGRVVALGLRENTAIYYQAADIYLDSFPFASITSCLEAGNYGVPIVGCNPFSPGTGVLCSDTPALENTMISVRTKAELATTLSRLVEDREYRTEIGRHTQESIQSVHTGIGWRQYLNELYRQAATRDFEPAGELKEERPMISELDIVSLEIDVLKVGEHMIYQDHIRWLPIGPRIRLWLKLLREKRMFRPTLLLSEWMAVQLINARARIRGAESG